MWSRFLFFILYCLAVTNCFSQSESQEPFEVDNSPSKDQGVIISRSERDIFPNSQGSSGFGENGNQNTNQHKFNVNNEGSSFGRPIGESNQNFNNRETESRPFSGSRPSSTGDSFFGQSTGNSNRPFESSPGSSNSFGRPTGSSSHTTDHREGESRPSGSRPGNSGDNLFGRPTGSSSPTTDHREGESRPSGSRPGSSGDNSFGRPTGSSSHTTDHREGESRPSGSRPGSSGNNSIGRPTGSSSHTTDHREGESRPSGSRPGSSGDNSFGRPTGSSSHTTDHREGENRPSGSRPGSSGNNSIGRPTGSSSHTTDHREGENRPSGSRPGSSSNNSIGRPTGSSDHTMGHRPIGENGPESRPSGTGDSFGKPIGGSSHNQQTGFKPDQGHLQGGETQRPDSHQNTGDFSNEPNKETSSSNNNENERPDKEDDKDVCFNHLGCFKMGKPWKTALRPIGAPYGPEKIQTTVHFYSRDNLERPKNITMYPQINMGEARFDPSKITAMIVHGFSNSGNATWMKDMKNVYLKKVDSNVMIVDWGKGAQLLNYFQVAGNTRVVGKQLGVFLKFLIDKYGADPGKFHLIGHSLGAQICSYVGKEVQGIARLTALDPAQPAFEGFDPQVRLDKNDAEFVDVIHTDARPFIPTLGFGMITPHGHVDFYMNGGFDQPGCVPPSKKDIPAIKSILDLAKFPVEVIAKAVACPHARAYEYLTEAFNETESCIFWGHKADVKNVFKTVTNTLTQGLLKKFTALSSTCSKEDCIPVGFATKKSPLRGVFVVTTNGRPPYCISEPGIPPETAPQERKRESFIQKIAGRGRIMK